jgi:hypothetical protein
MIFHYPNSMCVQIAGPYVVLNGADTFKATFAAPIVSMNTIIFFKLTVMDTAGPSENAIVLYLLLALSLLYNRTDDNGVQD